MGILVLDASRLLTRRNPRNPAGGVCSAHAATPGRGLALAKGDYATRGALALATLTRSARKASHVR